MPEKQKWIWFGAFGGFLLSIVAAIVITMTFSAASAGANRELIEGITGIVASSKIQCTSMESVY